MRHRRGEQLVTGNLLSGPGMNIHGTPPNHPPAARPQRRRDHRPDAAAASSGVPHAGQSGRCARGQSPSCGCGARPDRRHRGLRRRPVPVDDASERRLESACAACCHPAHSREPALGAGRIHNRLAAAASRSATPRCRLGRSRRVCATRTCMLNQGIGRHGALNSSSAHAQRRAPSTS